MTQTKSSWPDRLAAMLFARTAAARCAGQSTRGAKTDLPRTVPWWAIASAGLSPVVLTAAWLIAGWLQPTSYNPVRQTVSALAGLEGTDRWVMTLGLLIVGGCYLVTALGLTGVRLPARILLLVAGACSVGIATSPEPAHGPTLTHLAFTVLGAVTITIWPVTATWRAPLRPEIMSIRGSTVVTVMFIVLLGWVVLETHGGTDLGLAERIASTVQTAWPFVVAVALRRTMRHYRMRRTAGQAEPEQEGRTEQGR